VKDISLLEDKLGYKFKQEQLIIEALTHKSYKKPYNNERLEFLGDAVLELVVTDHLYRNYALPEGELTNLRAAVVRGEMLSQVALEIGLERFLLLSRGEQKGSQKARQ